MVLNLGLAGRVVVDDSLGEPGTVHLGIGEKVYTLTAQHAEQLAQALNIKAAAAQVNKDASQRAVAVVRPYRADEITRPIKAPTKRPCQWGRCNGSVPFNGGTCDNCGQRTTR